MQQIADWLEKLGLGQYAQRFAENDISFGILLHLTDQDLKELGVSSLGHRRQLLSAIADLSGVQKGAGQPASATEAAITLRDTAERRQVTVMFSDLVGSAALSARMDPEDLREVISAYQKCVAETVRRFGGFVAQCLGDGALVYFGYPEAHEDDTERAVHAALELIPAVSALKTRASLQTRVGIATGLVVVGDLIESGLAKEQAIIGETPNLAARLQSVAEPNSVVMAESTRKLVGNLFELEDLGANDVKGIVGPVRAWAALRASSVESRFEALHASGLTALVGREEEIELLLRRWSKAKTGEGQVVLLSGEAGIGKSRLTAALLERLATEPHTRLRYFCSPQHTDSALYPIIGHMERAAGFTRDDIPQTSLDKLDKLLAQTSTTAHDAALFAEMLSLPNDGRYPSLDELTSEQRRQRTLEALNAQMQALSLQNPVLMIFEDVHWTDPTSLEAFGRAVDRLRTLCVLLIVTFRPEFEPPWIGRPYVTTLIVNRLAQRDIEAMIGHVAGNRLIAASIRQDITERTDGIPLFVEEMTKAALEAESEVEAQRIAASISSPTLAVPASLHASLMARLDRLGAAKEVAQIGAAIGRQFPHALLAAIVHRREPELQWELDRLIAAGLWFRQGVPPYASYLFKHALVQDAAYGTLLRGPRRALHARIAETIEGQFADIAHNQPELLARHCTEAGLIEKAAILWGNAGRRSVARSALVEAAAQLASALDQIATLQATPALRREQISLQVAVITPLIHVKGYAAPETKAAVERARLLIEQAQARGEPPEDPLLLFSVLYGHWVANFVAFNGDICRDLASRFLALAAKQGTAAPSMIGHYIMGNSLLFSGELTEARTHFDEAVTLYVASEHRPLAMRFGQDVRVAVLSFRSWALWLLGYPNAALRDADQALRDAREIGHAATLMFALALTPHAHFLSANYATASAANKELLALACEKNAMYWKAVGTVLQGNLFAVTDKTSYAIQEITSGLAAFRSTGGTLYVPSWLSYLAIAYADLGKIDDAWRCIGEATTAVEMTKQRWCEAEVTRAAGEIILKSPERDALTAEAYFERALKVARQQQAKAWELRAAMSLARLWRDQGKPQQAHALLAPIYGWFTEGFDTRDLKGAKALLDMLSS
jgi:class 3 adenylate cyclase/predicted ATPase